MIGIIILYLLLGGLVISLYGLAHDSYFPFSEDADKEESCKMILIFAFWPMYIAYLVIKGIVWFFKHLWIAFDYFFKKYFKSDKSDKKGKFKSLLKK